MRSGADCPTVHEDATLADCYETMVKAPRNAGAAVVVDADGVLLGILTHGDFFRMFEQMDRLVHRPVGELMTRDPKRVNADDRAADALNLMRRHAIDEIPVVDDAGRLLGLIDIQDLIARGFSVLDQP